MTICVAPCGEKLACFPALTDVGVTSRARGRIASQGRANTVSYASEGSLMPRVIVTTASDVGKPRIGGPILLDEEVDLRQLDSPDRAPQFLERLAMALAG